MKTLTQQSGNPAYNLAQANLGTITDVDELRTEMLSVMARSEGIKDKKRVEFNRTCENIIDLDKLHGYLFNWMLKADGQGTVKTRFGEHIENRRRFR